MQRIDQNVYRLQRFQCFEIEVARLLAGWLPGIENWEAKRKVGQHLWQDAQHSRQIRTRLWELRKPDPDRDVQAVIRPVIQALSGAQHEAELLSGIYLVLKRQLLAAYQNYIETTFEVYDSPTIPILQKIITEKETQIAWAQSALASIINSGEKNRQVKRWRGYVTDVLAAIGGIEGSIGQTAVDLPPPPPGYSLLLPFPEAKRDKRFKIQTGTHAPPADHEPLQQTIWQFMNYGQEMQAAETIGSILWEVEEMPWEFYFDLARHCWDEVRHTQLGETRLAELGYHITDFPQAVGNYGWRQLLDPLQRYCALTYVIESDSFEYKHKTYKQYLQRGDVESAEAVLFDIMDETMHVRWGKKWVPKLIEQYGYEYSVEQLVTECRQITAEHSLAPQQVAAAKEKLKQS